MVLPLLSEPASHTEQPLHHSDLIVSAFCALIVIDLLISKLMSVSQKPRFLCDPDFLTALLARSTTKSPVQEPDVDGRDPL